MTRFRAFLTAAMVSLIAPAAVAAGRPGAPAHLAGEHRMTVAEVRDLARHGLVWCDGFHADTEDCDQVTLIEAQPDGRLVQTTTLLLETAPLLQAYLIEVDEVMGDRLCSVVDTATIPAGFTLEGKPVPEPTAGVLRKALLESLNDLQGKTVCQVFYRGADASRVREEITVDGKRRKDLESSYVLRDGEAGFALRAPPAEKSKGTHI